MRFLQEEVDTFLARYGALETDGRIPLKSSFRIEKFSEFSPDLILYEVLNGGTDFLCRLVGENVKANYGANQTGLRLSEIIATNPSVVGFRDNFDQVLTSRKPLRRVEDYTDMYGVRKTTIGVIAPLSRDGSDIDYCVCLALNAIKRDDRFEKATWDNRAYRR